MELIYYKKVIEDEVVLTPDEVACRERLMERSILPFIPDAIKVKFRNLAGAGVLAPIVVFAAYSKSWRLLDGVEEEYTNLHQKIRGMAAKDNKSYADYVKEHYKELTNLAWWMQAATERNGQLEIWAW